MKRVALALLLSGLAVSGAMADLSCTDRGDRKETRGSGPHELYEEMRVRRHGVMRQGSCR